MDPQQRYYLDAMGIAVWERRDVQPVEDEQAAPVVKEAPGASEKIPVQEARSEVKAGENISPAAAADDGVPTWLDDAPPIDEPISDLNEAPINEADTYPFVEEPSQPEIASLDWSALQQRVTDCSVCPELVNNRSQTVFGVGNQKADWMIIGEAPGADEDKQGEPFVGRAGQLLNAMLNALGLKRQQVYIANVLKCRPPNNRDPHAEEAAACEAFLKRQIALVQPKVILVVGRVAAQNLLKVDTPIGKLRGSVHKHEDGTPVVVTYHPAYLLRSPTEKRKSWVDLCLAQQVISSA